MTTNMGNIFNRFMDKTLLVEPLRCDRQLSLRSVNLK